MSTWIHEHVHFSYFSFTTKMDSSLVSNFALPCGLRGFHVNKELWNPRLRSRPHVVGYFGKRRIFSPNTATVHTYPAFSGTENGDFQIRSPGWKSFENGDSSYSCGRAKTGFSNTMTLCLGSRLALPHIRFENATCGRRFF